MRSNRNHGPRRHRSKVYRLDDGALFRAWLRAFSSQAGFDGVYLQQVSPAVPEVCFAKMRRIWAAIKRESLLAASEGVATPDEIDQIFKSVLKTPKGPFEQMDVVGLDVVLDIEEHYAAQRGNIPEEPRSYLKDFIASGKLGVKSGQGFYPYAGGGDRK